MHQKKISLILITLAILINFLTGLSFCLPSFMEYNENLYGDSLCTNPFIDFYGFTLFLAGVLGIAILPIILSTIISFIINLFTKKGFLHYFAILFLIFSLFALFISLPYDIPIKVTELIFMNF